MSAFIETDAKEQSVDQNTLGSGDTERSNPKVGRGIMFTIFPPHGDEEPVPPVYNAKVAKYLVFQLELCPSTKRFHYQTFVIPKSRQQRAKAVRTGLGINDDVHWDIVRGTRDEAQIYCRDPEKPSFIAGPWEFGE